MYTNLYTIHRNSWGEPSTSQQQKPLQWRGRIILFDVSFEWSYRQIDTHSLLCDMRTARGKKERRVEEVFSLSVMQLE